jgi:histone H3/H4
MSNQVQPILPFAPVERVIRKAGADRVAKDAGVELAKVLEEYGIEISREAIILAKHAKRTTVKEEDIRLAVARLKKPSWALGQKAYDWCSFLIGACI